MPKPKPIQINISTPCSQPWEQMTPDAQGRHCAHCSKTVIDFTTWGDAALYNFFSQNTDRVCGRFFATQLSRPLYIPPQPHSRLYRMTIALGLTLIFTQSVNSFAQASSPLVTQLNRTRQTSDIDTVANGSGMASGKVIDINSKNEMMAVLVQVYQDGILKRATETDFEGNYSINNLELGRYDLLVTYPGYDSVNISKVQVGGNFNTTVHFSLTRTGSDTPVIINNTRLGLVIPKYEREIRKHKTNR